MTNDAMNLPHSLGLKDRKTLTLTGVTEVVSFDDQAVLLATTLGNLHIQGQGLKLKQLTLEGGQVEVQGKIDALVYEEPRQGGWLRRLMG